MPGSTAKMDPRSDHGETSYKGSGKLTGKKAVIIGGDSGIGRAVAIAYAREGADILIAYLDEHDDANQVKALIEKEGRRAVLVAGDLRHPEHCRSVIKRCRGVGRYRYPRQQCAPGHVQGHPRDQRRGMATDIRGQHPRDVLSDQSRGAPREAGQRDHQHGINQFRHAEPDPAGLRNNQRRRPELGGLAQMPPRKVFVRMPWRRGRSGHH
jgi:hypothetical protein